MPDEDPTTGGPQGGRPDQRTGEDTRRRGWFWHWNTIVTQYSPLIGLKGVGLLNSYTVWTDRREDSPHRGFAFPSQQSEASFYGEDRAELITINKILVALDLIEVRKEMVLHVDEKGRRWRVPHNLYRVKDNPSGFTLTVEDVLRVAELAARTPAVYRYIRRVFSPNFAPIDSKNPWHDILPAVRQTELWQKLAARAAREDARASARSKAGHRKRKGKTGEDDEPAARPSDESDSAPVDLGMRHDDTAAAGLEPEEVAHSVHLESSVAASNTDESTDVQSANNGSANDVARSNRALSPKTPTSDERVNEGDESIVQPVNTTYYQEPTSTTRTTTESDVETASNEDQERHDHPDEPGSGPILQGSPQALAAFESANDRTPTALERELLGELERDFADAAQRAGQAAAEWVVQAIREAVNSGSRFVAPKRIREILNRWSASQSRDVRQAGETASREVERSSAKPGIDEVGQAWRAIVAELQAAQEWAEFHAVLTESALLGEDSGKIRIGLPQSHLPESVIGHIHQALEPRFVTRLGRDVSVQLEEVAAPAKQSPETLRESPDPVDTGESLRTPPPAPPPKFSVTDGLTNSQVWAAAQDDLRQRLSSANYETWIRPASLIGHDDSGRLVLGVPSRFAQQRVEAKLREDIEAALSRIVGHAVEVRVELSQQWLRQQGGIEARPRVDQSPD